VSPPNSGQCNCKHCPVAKIPDRERARYLLASDLIQQQGEKALKAMDSLEQNYPVLAANIALKRAPSIRPDRGQSKAQAARHLLKRYPDHPAAEAVVLGRNQPKY